MYLERLGPIDRTPGIPGSDKNPTTKNSLKCGIIPKLKSFYTSAASDASDKYQVFLRDGLMKVLIKTAEVTVGWAVIR